MIGLNSSIINNDTLLTNNNITIIIDMIINKSYKYYTLSVMRVKQIKFVKNISSDSTNLPQKIISVMILIMLSQ